MDEPTNELELQYEKPPCSNQLRNVLQGHSWVILDTNQSK